MSLFLAFCVRSHTMVVELECLEERLRGLLRGRFHTRPRVCRGERFQISFQVGCVRLLRRRSVFRALFFAVFFRVVWFFVRVPGLVRCRRRRVAWVTKRWVEFILVVFDLCCFLYFGRPLYSLLSEGLGWSQRKV